VSELYLIQAVLADRILQLECSKDVLLLNGEMKWAQVKYVKEGDKIFGLSDSK
jgi:hypothetical protein